MHIRIEYPVTINIVYNIYLYYIYYILPHSIFAGSLMSLDDHTMDLVKESAVCHTAGTYNGIIAGVACYYVGFSGSDVKFPEIYFCLEISGNVVLCQISGNFVNFRKFSKFSEISKNIRISMSNRIISGYKQNFRIFGAHHQTLWNFSSNFPLNTKLHRKPVNFIFQSA